MNRWTAEQKAEALRIYEQHGAPFAARQTKIPRTTIQRWARVDGIRCSLVTDRAAKTEAARTARVLVWEKRREGLIHKAGRVAEQALEECVLALESAEGSESANFAKTFGILVDKAQLLSGGATSRPNVDPGTLLTEGRAKVMGLVPQRKAG